MLLQSEQQRSWLREIPCRAGVGLKAEHYQVILETRPSVGFLEVHAENYMGAGGPPHRYLTAIRDHYPLSLHGVGLSIGADRSIDLDHLSRIKDLIDRYQPGLFSEHLAWSSHGETFFNDLLPVPYTAETLALVTAHIGAVQEKIGRQMLLENPSTYVSFTESTYSETDFIEEVVRRSGCGLLLDVNNVYVASTNNGWDAVHYLDKFPLAHVQEIHLAGFTRDADERGQPLLIDTHDGFVDDVVWSLFEMVIGRLGPTPTLIEWDSKVPAWSDLKSEADRAESTLVASKRKELPCSC